MSLVGLIVALPAEKSTLTKARIRSGHFSRLNDKTLLSLSGIGPDKARRAAEILVEQGSNALLSWGCAAALDPRLQAGDLVIPEKVSCAQGESLRTDSGWRTKVLDGLADHASIHEGAIMESRTLVANAADKKTLHERIGAIALDMESAAIARVAVRHRLPFLAVRAIADRADMDLPKPVANAMDRNGDLNMPLLLALIFAYPNSLPALLRLGRCFRAARRSLRSVALRLEYDFRPETRST